MSVVHTGGWTTTYYHLDNSQVGDLEPVERDDISNYANNEAQAICQGGVASTGPRVHTALYRDGLRVEVDESNVDFTAFSHHIGIGHYDLNCATSWYNHYTLGILCPANVMLLNDAPAVAIFADGFESGDVTVW